MGIRGAVDLLPRANFCRAQQGTYIIFVKRMYVSVLFLHVIYVFILYRWLPSLQTVQALTAAG